MELLYYNEKGSTKPGQLQGVHGPVDRTEPPVTDNLRTVVVQNFHSGLEIRFATASISPTCQTGSISDPS